jgi:hypothetical protein
VSRHRPDAGPRPEADLLLAAARVQPGAGAAERIRGLARGPLDWRYLLRIARRHGLMPLLYWHLNALCPEAVPAAALAALRDHFASNLRHNLLLTGELRTLLKRFEAAAVRAVPFKGPALTAALYGNLALREFCDLDVLVHRDDVPRARTMLESLGYRSDWPLTEAQTVTFVRHHTDLSFRDKGRGILLEIHWEFLPKLLGFALDPARAWRRLERVSLGGEAVPTLSPADTLLLATAHGCKHGWERLAWVCDVAEWLRVHRDADWQAIHGQASRLGCRRMVLLGLVLARDLLGSELPDDVMRDLRKDLTVLSLARQVYGQLFLEEELRPGLLGRWLFHVRARERLQDRLRYLLRLGLAPTVFDWQAAPLPSRLYFLSYLVRPVRLATKYTRSAMGRFRSSWKSSS